ncbi:MAG: hypothetical protein HRU15_17460 [Planctomycetes bacterium]|nr:hypothetical protein [Planctomycetota bacterium]
MSDAAQFEVLQQQLEDKINELSDAKSQVMKLRKTMLQQLTALGNITRPLFELDKEYFGGKFQDREDGSNPFQEVQLAVEVVNAAREHFTGKGAMDDSPVLREQLGNMVEALEGLRDTVLSMRRDGLEAVGLPIDDSGFHARVFPDTDPVASIVDASELVHEIHGVCQRTAGRIKALVAMRDDADEVRGQAEDQLEEFKASPEAIAEIARRETETLQGELNALRVAMAQMQEQGASQPATAAGDGRNSHDAALLRGLQDELERMHGDRLEDMAEVRSLSGDISMLAGEMSKSLANEELDTARIALKNLLAGDAEIGAMASAAETVFLRLAESLQNRIEHISSDLDQMADQQHQQADKIESAEAADSADAARAAESSAQAAQAALAAEEARAALDQSREEATGLREEIEALKSSVLSAQESAEAGKSAQESAQESAQQEISVLRSEVESAHSTCESLRQQIDSSGHSAS